MNPFEVILNILFFVINLFFLVKNFRDKAALTILLGNVYFILYGILFSTFIIESGEYVSEQDMWGFSNHASLFVQTFIFIVSYSVRRIRNDHFLADDSAERMPIAEYSSGGSKVIIAAVLGLVLLNAIIIFSWGYGIDRDRFNPFGSFPYKNAMTTLNYWISGLIPFLILRINRKYTLHMILLIVMNGLIQFTSVAILFSLLVPVGFLFLRNRSKVRWQQNRFRYLLGIGILGAAGLVFVLYVKSLEYADGGLLSLYSRYVVQGQLFWGSINHQGEADLSHQLRNFLSAFFDLGDNFVISPHYGFGYLMVFISGDLAYRYMEELGIRMTSGMPAILIVNFGLLPSLVLFGAIIFGYIWYLKYYIRSLFLENIMLFFLFTKINVAVVEFLFIGEYGKFNLRNVLWLLLYVFLSNLFRSAKGKKKSALSPPGSPVPGTSLSFSR